MKLKNLADTGEKRMLLRRIIVYSISFFLLGVLQCAFFSKLKPFGATPDIVLGGICAVLMLDNKRAAAVCAVAAGYFIDALGAAMPSFTPVFYLLAVALISAFAEKMMPSIVSFAVAMLAFCALGAIFTWLGMCLTYSALVPILTVWQTLVRTALSTLICSLPVYFVIKLCTLPIEL